ncbi:kinase-like domain-containing protein, partial [Hyaloraphidium curvatum]
DFLFNPLNGGTRSDSDISSIPDSPYHITRTELGRGNFSTVRLAINVTTAERLAVKIIDKRQTSLGADSMVTDVAIATEVAILKSCNHPNIVRLCDVEANKRVVCIYLQRVRGGSMLDRLESGPYPETEAVFLFFQVLQGVKYLHAKNISHRDIKAENAMIETYGPITRVLLTDFGMSRAVGRTAMTTRCGTLAYCSPELLKDGTYDKATDIWSAGVLLYVMLTGKLPFFSNDDAEIASRIRAGAFDRASLALPEISDAARDMCQTLMTTDRRKRPAAEAAMEHPWIANKKEILSKLYDKMVRKCGWLAANGETAPPKTLVAATPDPKVSGTRAAPTSATPLGLAESPVSSEPTPSKRARGLSPAAAAPKTSHLHIPKGDHQTTYLSRHSKLRKEDKSRRQSLRK